MYFKSNGSSSKRDHERLHENKESEDRQIRVVQSSNTNTTTSKNVESTCLETPPQSPGIIHQVSQTADKSKSSDDQDSPPDWLNFKKRLKGKTIYHCQKCNLEIINQWKHHFRSHLKSEELKKLPVRHKCSQCDLYLENEAVRKYHETKHARGGEMDEDSMSERSSECDTECSSEVSDLRSDESILSQEISPGRSKTTPELVGVEITRILVAKICGWLRF